MSSALEKSLDEIIGDQPRRRAPRGGRGGSRARGPTRHSREPRDNYKPPRRETKSEFDELAEGRSYLRVRNLHYELTEQDIFELFSKVGEVKFARMEFDNTGRSKGVAYVCYEEPNAHNSVAISKFDGKKAAGRNIVVEVATSLKDRISAIPVSERIKERREFERGHIRSSERRPKSSNRGGPGSRIKLAKAKRSVDDLDSELDSYMNGLSSSEVKVKKSLDTLDDELESYMKRPEGPPNVTIPAVETEYQSSSSEPFAAVSGGDGMALD